MGDIQLTGTAKKYGAAMSRNARAPTGKERDSWMVKEPTSLFGDKMVEKAVEVPDHMKTLSSCPSREANIWAAIPGGDGLPKNLSDLPEHALESMEAGPMAPIDPRKPKKRSIVGDGGASWRARQLQRMREKAERDGDNVDDVAADLGYNVRDMKRDIDNRRHKSGKMGRLATRNNRDADGKLHEHGSRVLKMMRPRDDGPARSGSRGGDRGKGGRNYDPMGWQAGQDKEAADKRKGEGGSRKDEKRGYKLTLRGGTEAERDREAERSRKEDSRKGREGRKEDRGRESREGREGKGKGKRAAQSDTRERQATKPRHEESRAMNKMADDGSFMKQFKAERGTEQSVKGARPAAAASGPIVVPAAVAVSSSAGGDPNKLAAEAIRARLSGDMAKFKSLMARVEKLRGGGGGAAAAPKATNASYVKDENVKVVILDQLDAHGRPREFSTREKVKILPGNGRRDLGGRDGKGPDTQLRAGQRRERYFADDDVSLEELVARERKEGRQAKYDDMYAQNIMKDKKHKDRYDSDEEYGEGSSLHEKYAKKQSSKHADKDWKKEHDRQVGEDRRIKKQITNVLESPITAKHLVISLGEHAFLALPKRGSLQTGHCLILPLESTPSTVACNEAVAAEVLRFKRCVATMFRKVINKSVIFMETVTGADLKHNRHFTIECIPIPHDVMQQAPGYYKKALHECDAEWSQHESKRCMDTREKPLTKCVPESFPFFHVEFGPGGGYAHVIEDHNLFPNQLGKQVLVGMLEIDATVLAKPRTLPMDQDLKRVKGFIKSFEAYDWTRELEGGEYA